MKERPILFSSSMVRALLAGTKTQTRRAAKPRRNPSLLDGSWSDEYVLDPGNREWLMRDCPYGQPGDRLWVRETWRIGAWDEDRGAFALDYCDGPRKEWLVPFATATEEPHEVFSRLWQDCCDELRAKQIHEHDGRYKWNSGESPLRWRPSIHMPRWASRILLEITAVRVERLQDIGERDAVAEGLHREPHHWHDPEYPLPDVAYRPFEGSKFRYSCARQAYQDLWESINGAGSWTANPWVWVVEFRRIEK